jgi:hypothetical protein
LHRTIYKFVGDGTATITLAEIAHAVSGFPQTIDGTPNVSIIGASSSLPDNQSVTIVRGGVTVLQLYGQYSLPQDEIGTIKLAEQSTKDIVVTMAASGTLFLELRKDSGYTFGPSVDGDTR